MDDGAKIASLIDLGVFQYKKEKRKLNISNENEQIDPKSNEFVYYSNKAGLLDKKNCGFCLFIVMKENNRIECR